MPRSKSGILLSCFLLLILLGIKPPLISGFFYVHFWRVNYSGYLIVSGNQSYPLSTRWDYIGNASWQECQMLSMHMSLNNDTIVPTNLTTDPNGNPELILNISTPLQPNDVLSWREEWLFIVRDRRRDLPQISIDQAGTIDDIEPAMGIGEYFQYTRPTSLWKTDNGTLIDIANQIQNNVTESHQTNVLSLILASINWINHNIHRSTTSTAPQYPEELLVSREGDCDDQSNLLIVLLRILGIPCYLMTGHWYQEGATTIGFLWGTPEENAYLYVHWQNVLGHGWAMVYVPPWGWLPFDLLANNLGSNPANAYFESLFASGSPMVSLWKCHATDYIAEQRNEEQHIFEYKLHRSNVEEWSTLGSVPILDLPYFATNITTIMALIATMSLLTALVLLSMRRQLRKEQKG